MKVNNLFLLFFLCSIALFAQGSLGDSDPFDSTSNVNKLKTIYTNLEYPTTTFDDLNSTWTLTDAFLVREVFNRLINRRALRIENNVPSREQIDRRVEEIFNGKVYIQFQRRYYDKEINLMRFVYSQPERDSAEGKIFDDIIDNVYIKGVLGDKTYNILREQNYALTDVTKDFYGSNIGYNFDLYFHALEPRIMFWNTTSDYTTKDKYLLSFYGKWGEDYISLPGWHFPDYIAGISLDYVDSVRNDIVQTTWSFKLGTNFDTKQTIYSSGANERRLYSTGSGLYFGFSGNPLSYWEIKDFTFAFEGFMTFTEMQVDDFGIDYFSKFFSLRNYYLFYGRKSNVIDLSNFGSVEVTAGISLKSFSEYLLMPERIKLQKLGTKYDLNVQPFTEVSVSRFGGLIQHKIGTMFAYDVNQGYGFGGIKLYFMLSNTLGFDIRYFSTIGGGKALPYYQPAGYYIVFSPVLRINY